MTKIEEIADIFKKKYNASLWNGGNFYRIYFKHTPKVETYIQLRVVDDEILGISFKCSYVGKKIAHKVAEDNYICDAEEFIFERYKDVVSLVKGMDSIN